MKKIYLLVLANLAIFLSSAQIVLPDSIFPNSIVSAIANIGNTVYIGGHFTAIGKSQPYGASLSTESGTPDFNVVVPNGTVFSSRSDGAGGWYIGGDFTQVGGQPRNRLARINADGSL